MSHDINIENQLDLLMEKINEAKLFYQFYLDDKDKPGRYSDWSRFQQPVVHLHIIAERLLKMRAPD